MELPKKQIPFYEFFFAALKFRSNFEHCEKRITLIAYGFPKLGTAKNVVKNIDENSRL